MMAPTAPSAFLAIFARGNSSGIFDHYHDLSQHLQPSAFLTSVSSVLSVVICLKDVTLSPGFSQFRHLGPGVPEKFAGNDFFLPTFPIPADVETPHTS